MSMPILNSLRRALPVLVAFAAGAALSPWLLHALPEAHAQGSALMPQLLDVAALKDADLAQTPNPDLKSKTYVVTEHGTIAVQIGNVAKHFHSNTDEIQYIVEGSGTAWLGNERKEIRPGMLLVIPRGTHHAGTEASSGRFKAIAIKLPPQDPKDTTFVP